MGMPVATPRGGDGEISPSFANIYLTHSLVIFRQGTATSIKSIFRKKDKAPAASDRKAIPLAAAEEGDAAQRKLNHKSGNWCDQKHEKYEWHPQYYAGWTKGFCGFIKDCNSPGYSTELACCKHAYAGQMSRYCVSKLPSPPTTSPTKGGGLDVYYPDYDTAWTEAGCINNYPMPSGRPMYTTMVACCKHAYGGQVSGE